MALEAFKGSQPAPIRQSTSGQNVAVQYAQQVHQELGQKLSSFSKAMFQQAGYQAQDQAVEDAKKASLNGEEFHKKSVYTVYGRAYNTAGSATYAANANLKIQEESNKLSIDYENDPVGYSTKMGTFIDGLRNDAPTNDLASVIKISGDKLRNSTFGKLSIVENNRIKANQIEVFQQEAALNQAQVIDLMDANNMKDANILLDKNQAHLDGLVREGTISKADALAYTDKAEFEISYGVGIKHMEGLLEEGNMEEASAFLTGQTSENREDMDVTQNKKYQDDLTKIYNNKLKALKAENSGNKEYANLILGKVNNILAAGKTPPLDLFNEAKKISEDASLKSQDSFSTNIAAYDEIKKYDYMSLPEQEVLLATLKSATEATNVDVAVMKQVEKNLSTRKTAAKKDPQSQGVVEGRLNPLVPMNVSNGLQVVMNELPNRVKNQQANRLEYGEGATQLFTDAEASEWTAYLESADTSIDDKLSFINAVNSSAPDSINAVYSQLRKKGATVFSYAASMVSENKVEVARGILRGQQLLKEAGNQEYIKTFKTELLSDMGNSMQYAGDGDRASLLDASLAYSMYLAEQRGDVTNLKGSSERQAMNDLTNGMHKRNGQDFFLPSGVDKDGFDEWVDEELSADDFVGVAGITPDQALLLVQGKGRLVSYGPGKYAIYGSGRKTVKNANGSVFILEK